MKCKLRYFESIWLSFLIYNFFFFYEEKHPNLSPLKFQERSLLGSDLPSVKTFQFKLVLEQEFALEFFF